MDNGTVSIICLIAIAIGVWVLVIAGSNAV
jgi:hypothetical protein